MEVNKVIPSGYCKGVINAINLVKKAVKQYPDKQIYILGMLVHNRYVVDAFKLSNVITLSDPSKTRLELIDSINDGVIVFSAHGIDPKLKQHAIDKGLIVVDATCPDVTKNATLCLDHLSKGYDIIYIGKRNHPESDAVMALSNHIHLVTSQKDIDDLAIDNSKILITNQTTMSIIDIAELIKSIDEKYPQALLCEEICNATRNRQNAIAKLEDYDALIVVGDPNSNNTTQLANIGKRNIKQVFKVECASQLADYDFSSYQRIAVTSGASTPSYLTSQVIDYLRSSDKQYFTIDLNRILDL